MICLYILRDQERHVAVLVVAGHAGGADSAGILFPGLRQVGVGSPASETNWWLIVVTIAVINGVNSGYYRG